MIASSFSGALAHDKRNAIDFKLGSVLPLGGIIGSTFGAWIFACLRRLGQLDLVVSILYVVFLGAVGGPTLIESVRTLRQRKTGG